jgi:hypothetical protein
MTSKGSIKSNDFARGAGQKGQVTQDEKKAARQALLEKARAAANNK